MNRKISKNAWSWVPSLYFAEGLPYVAVMTISLVLYKQLGLTNAEITFYTSWLYLPWVIKPLWSPFVDIVKTKRWWVITMQLLIGAAFGGVAFTIPTDFWLQGTLFFFWIMAFSSATHDIAADGFYMLGLDQHKQAWFVGIRSTFYRLATIFGQGALVFIAGLMETSSGNIPFAWTMTLIICAVIFGAMSLYHTFILPRPASDCPRLSPDQYSGRAAGIFREFGRTFATFFMKKQIWLGIAFMLLYRLPEAFLVKMLNPFLLDPVDAGGLGLSTENVGLVYGTVGVAALTVGGILGGMAAAKWGLKKVLWPMALSLALPCSVFLYLGMVQPENLWLISACVALDQFGYGFGFTAYMLYLIMFSEGEFKTAHYSLCTAFMAMSMMIPGMFAGYLQEWLGYVDFFWMVMVCCLATVAVTAFVKVDPAFGKKHEN